MKSCSFGLFIFATVIFLPCLRSTGAASCHPDDEAGLLAFNSGITRDPSGLLSSWKKGSDCCSWKGVTCISDRVALLELDGRSDAAETFLSGTISPSLAKLQHLSEIYLSNLRKIKGSFPQFLFQLPKLKELFPFRITNNLSGMIPDYLSRFEGLSLLDLSKNRYSGVVPKSFANLTRLYDLNLSHNLLTGPFPILDVSDMESLDLSYNQIQMKTIPKWVTLLPIINSLKLAKCGIKMSLDDWKPTALNFYDVIDLSENEISGSPAWFLNQTMFLLEFRASGNKLLFDMGKLTFAKRMTTLDVFVGVWDSASDRGWTGETELESQPSLWEASGNKVSG
ncbi:unnamed protein product [Arabidopsis lyrata]|nr:unnamed protein product [Arabidopsis lyrata]